MKDTGINKIWYIVYPIGVYYVLTNVITFLICLVVPFSNQSYSFIKVLSTLITLPFIYKIYRMDEMARGRLNPEWKTLMQSFKKDIPKVLGIIVMTASLSIVLNNVIAWTPLIQSSKSYRQVSEAFYGGNIIFEILGPCIFVPILEEYVFRGLVYRRLRQWLSVAWAIVLSALIFGIMHMNLVQFVYAGLLGLFLALCAEQTQYLYGAIAAHMTANTISVIRTETTWLAWMKKSFEVELCVTIGLSLLFIGCFVLFKFNHIIRRTA